MKNVLVGAVALGLAGAPVLAGSNVTNLGGTPGSSWSTSTMDAHYWNFQEGLGGGYQGNLYDNIPTFLGGTSTGQVTFGAFGTVPGTFLFIDWTAATAQWSDNLQGLAPGSQITNVWYAYSHGTPSTPGITSTHIVKIYDLLPPGPVPGVSAVSAGVGALLASVVMPGMPATGIYSVVASLSSSITIPNSGVWVKLEEIGDPAFATFWLTGGRPGVGSTVDGPLFSVKYPYGGAYNYQVGGIYPSTGGGAPVGPPGSFIFGAGYAMLNASIGLNAKIPAPATIGVLAIGGLFSLRRRR